MTPPGGPSPTSPAPAGATEPSPRPSPAAALFAWLLIQMAMLVIAARDVPLWARFPAEGDRLAVHEMLVAQIIASALLFPWLLRDGVTTLLVAAAAIAFGQVSAFIAGASHMRALLAGAYVVGWLIGLALWRDALSRWRATMPGVASAAALSLGGVVIAYLQAERWMPSEHSIPSHQLGPIMGALSQLDAAAGPSRWGFLIAFLLTSVLVRLFSRSR